MAEHRFTPSVITITMHTTRANYVNVVIFTQYLHHHAHVRGASEASISHTLSSRSGRCYLYVELQNSLFRNQKRLKFYPLQAPYPN